MISLLLPDEELLAKMAPVYAARGVSATYRRHTGTIRESGANVDQYEEFDIVALIGQRRKYSKKAGTNEVDVQKLNTAFIFRTTDLLAGIEFKDLSENDKVAYEGQELGVINLQLVSPFIRFEIQGG